MSTPRHPATGQYTAAAGLPDGDAVNQELASKPDQPGAPCPPVPDVPDHDEAMGTGREAYMTGLPGEMTLPPSPDDGSKHTGPV